MSMDNSKKERIKKDSSHLFCLPDNSDSTLVEEKPCSSFLDDGMRVIEISE